MRAGARNHSGAEGLAVSGGDDPSGLRRRSGCPPETVSGTGALLRARLRLISILDCVVFDPCVVTSDMVNAKEVPR